MAIAVGAGHDHGRKVRARPYETGEPRIKLLGNDQQLCAAVGEHESIIVLMKQRIHRNGDDTRLDGAEECRRPIDGVRETNQNPVFSRNTEIAQHMSEA